MAVKMSEVMEETLCLATKATNTTIHVCARAVGHTDDHFDPIDGVSWVDAPAVANQVPDREAA